MLFETHLIVLLLNYCYQTKATSVRNACVYLFDCCSNRHNTLTVGSFVGILGAFLVGGRQDEWQEKEEW